MKVLLLYKSNTSDDDFESRQTPFGLYYIAAVLIDNNVDVVLENLSNKSWQEVESLVKEHSPDVVGISCYTFNRHICFELARIVKKINDKIITLLGGTHATLYYKQILKNYPQVDYVLVGEAEFSTLEFVDTIKNKKPVEDIKGLAFRKDDTIVFNERPVIENLDDVPIPAKYFSYKGIITTRGCPGACVFCASPKLWKHRVRFRTPGNVVDELEMLNKKYGISQFFVNDDTFTCRKDWVVSLCNEIIKRNLHIIWGCSSRVNSVDKEMLSLMKKAGCLSIYYGVESGSQKILDNTKKYTKVSQILNASQWAREVGMELKFYLMVGCPGESEETINETIDVIRKARPQQIEINILQLMVGTELFKDAVEKGLISEKEFLENDHKPLFYTFEHSYEKLVEFRKKISDFFIANQKNFGYSYDEIIAIKDSLNDAHSYYLLALHKVAEKKVNEAVDLLQKVIELNPGFAPAYNLLGAIYASSGNKEKAVEMFNQSVKCNPTNVKALLNFGNVLLDLGRVDDAEKIYDKVLDMDPGVFKAYQNLASIYHFRGDNENAFALLEKGPSKLKPLLDKLKEDIKKRIS